MTREFEAQPSFADQVAEATGLAPVLASGVVERCCKRAGVLVSQLKPSDIETLLPHLEASLLVYNKSGREVLAALERLKRLATLAATAATMTIFPVDDAPRSARHESFIRERSAFPARRTGSR
jgi:hypothetical protein